MRVPIRRWAVAGLVMAVAVALAGCVLKDSPAPGCIQYLGRPPATGCFGTTVIQGITVSPSDSCIEVTTNNCNGGVLEIRNNCSEAVQVGGESIVPGLFADYDVTSDGAGGYMIVPTSGNVSHFAPDADVPVLAVATIGTEEVTISFTKTAPLCQ